jgi:Na+-driven multidrug efflux pump
VEITTQGGYQVSARPAVRRRNNAPVRPPRPATSVPDFLFALAMCAWVMAAIFVVATFTYDDLSAGDAGTDLARLFAASLALAGGCGFLIGVMLLRGERRRADHYVTPVIIGAVMGTLEAILFLWPAEAFLFAPFALLVFVFRPVRRHLSRMVRPGSDIFR